MANIPAAQSGPFEAGETWVGGVVPGPSDVAFANTFTVTISDARTVQALSAGSGTGITAGGVFSLLNGCDLSFTNATGILAGLANTPVVNTNSLGAGSSAVVSGPALTPNLPIGTSNTSVNHSGLGTLHLVTNIAAHGSWFNQVQLNGGLVILSGGGTLNTTGSVTGPAGVVGNQIGAAVLVSGNGTLNHTGSVTGGSTSAGTLLNGQGFGILVTASNATVTVNGSVTGGTNTYNPGIGNNSSSTLTVNGACTSGATSPAIGPGTTNQITRLSGPLLLGASGNINPVQAQSWRWAPTLVPTYMQVTQANGSTLRLLYSADNMPNGGYPVISNVRLDVMYGPNNEMVGTLAVAPPSSVAVGVSTDNTVGTAVLTAAAAAAAVWGADTRTLTSSSGSAPTAAEVAVAVRSELITELGRVDAAISTRLAATSYSAAPSTAAIRTEMDANSTRLASLNAQMPNKASVDQVAEIVQNATSA